MTEVVDIAPCFYAFMGGICLGITLLVFPLMIRFVFRMGNIVVQ